MPLMPPAALFTLLTPALKPMKVFAMAESGIAAKAVEPIIWRAEVDERAFQVVAIPMPEIASVAPGEVVEIPTLVFAVSSVNSGIAEVEVAIEKAFTREEGIVLVLDEA